MKLIDLKSGLWQKDTAKLKGLTIKKHFHLKMNTLRSIIAIATDENWMMYEIDVFNAFLQGDLIEEVYMDMPKGFSKKGEQQGCKLMKSLYGLKQASRQWNAKLTNDLSRSEYTQSHLDYSLLTKRN